MASKQQIAKEKQQYNPKPAPITCVNCAHYRSNFVDDNHCFEAGLKETNIRCGLGGFAVKKTATCMEYRSMEYRKKDVK